MSRVCKVSKPSILMMTFSFQSSDYSLYRWIKYAGKHRLLGVSTSELIRLAIRYFWGTDPLYWEQVILERYSIGLLVWPAGSLASDRNNLFTILLLELKKNTLKGVRLLWGMSKVDFCRLVFVLVLRVC